jgi:hypothetical protein
MSKIGAAAYRYVFTPMRSLGLMDLMRRGPRDSLHAFLGRRALQSWVDQSLLQQKTTNCIPGHQPTEITLVGGQKQRDLLFVCLMSIYKTWPSVPPVCVVSDGTMTPELRKSLVTIFPGSRVVSDAEQEDALERQFPTSAYPALRGLRQYYVQIRKMLDVCSQTDNRILLLDTDTVFYRTPEALFRYLEKGSPSCYLLDPCADSYGYPLGALRGLSGATLKPRINVGLLAIDVDQIDWPKVESWARHLLDVFGFNFFIEQALWALILSEREACALPEADYICMPCAKQARSRSAVFHHYVSPSRHLFYAYGWQPIRKLLNER